MLFSHSIETVSLYFQPRLSSLVISVAVWLRHWGKAHLESLTHINPPRPSKCISGPASPACSSNKVLSLNNWFALPPPPPTWTPLSCAKSSVVPTTRSHSSSLSLSSAAAQSHKHMLSLCRSSWTFTRSVWTRANKVTLEVRNAAQT